MLLGKWSSPLIIAGAVECFGRAFPSLMTAIAARAMTFFCFVELSGSSTPHMEPLEASSLAAAKAEARALLACHSDGVSAVIRQFDQVVATFSAAEAA